MFKKIISVSLIGLILIILSSFNVFAHSGNLDSLGGHNVNTPTAGYEVGTYHYHTGPYAGWIVDKKGDIPDKSKDKFDATLVYKTIELTSLLSNQMDFKKCKVIIGDYNKIFGEEGDWVITTIPINIKNNNEVDIKILIKEDSSWKTIEDKLYPLDQGDNKIIINYVDDNDKKVNIKINLYNKCQATITPTNTDTSTPTPTATITPTNTNSSTPTATITSTTNIPTITPTTTATITSTQGELPQTGEANMIIPGIISFLMIGTGSILMLKRKKEE